MPLWGVSPRAWVRGARETGMQRKSFSLNPAQSISFQSAGNRAPVDAGEDDAPVACVVEDSPRSGGQRWGEMKARQHGAVGGVDAGALLSLHAGLDAGE